VRDTRYAIEINSKNMCNDQGQEWEKGERKLAKIPRNYTGKIKNSHPPPPNYLS
jgi:hypothetical protein